MDNLLGYNILEQLYSGEKIIVSRALRKADNRTVVLKMLKAEYPDPDDIARLSYEYNLLKDLSIPELIQTYGFEKQQNRFAIVLESIPNSYKLRTFLSNHKLSIETFLRLAIQLAEALDKIHEAGIIHKDINPDNILIIGDGEKIKLFDLSIATQLSEEEHEITHPEMLEGTLPYISPEQTTRMNRCVDRRTDLYSLGITFYEMLTGHLPFDAKDAIEWVHYHIAKQPIPPHKLSPEIPEVLSLIILKLLSKSAEDRYATAYGLKEDLETCLLSWQKKHSIPTFVLGLKDRKGIFKIPQKLYGREDEIKTLMDVFDEVSVGNRELLLVSGYSGIGKSSLIHEVQKPIVKQYGYFTFGKYEQYNHDVPYAGLIQAFENLIKQVLSENKHKIEYWRQQIIKATAPNAQVIINVIPELEKLIGKQPPVIELPPTESRTRFELVFFDFVNTFAKKDHPLVIFLDDIQWADSGSFTLITQLLKDTELKYFLLLCAYRNNEIYSTHPLLTTLEQINKAKISYTELQLKPLSVNSVSQLICDTLHTNKNIESLAELVMQKTGGNPYFVNLFLTTLYKTHYLQYDPVDHWIWDLQEIKNLSITDNVADLVISEIGKLPVETQELLKLSSCIGTHFDLKTLSLLAGKNPEEITPLIWPALTERWVIQLGESYKLTTKNTKYNTNCISMTYKFSHDNVKNALYSLLGEDQRKEIHYKIGKILLNEKKEKDENIFNIAQHFSSCIDLLKNPKEKIQISELFRHAAKMAKLSISYDMAIKYYENTITLLGPYIWKDHYDLAIDLFNNLATCLYLSGSFNEANLLFKEIIENAKNPLDKAKIMISRSLSYAAQSQYAETVAICEEGLHVLGVKIPHNPSKLRLIIAWFKTKWYLRRKNIDDLLNLPIMQDPKKILIMELLEKIATASYVASPSNFNRPAYAIMLTISYSLRYGNHMNSPICYLHYGQIEITRGNIERAFKFSQLAVKLCERFQNTNLPIAYLLAIIRIFPWKLTYKECFNYAIKAFELSYESGQLYAHQYSSLAIAITMYCANYPLPEVEKKINNLLTDHQCTYNNDVYSFLKVFQLFIQVLRGEKPFHEYQEFVSHVTFTSSIRSPLISVTGLKTFELFLAYVFEDWPLALKIIAETHHTFMKKPLNSSISSPAYYFCCGLTLLRVYHDASFINRILYKIKLNSILKKFNFWQQHCPDNYESQFFLLKAGLAELQDDMDQAIIYYEQSIASARSNDRISVEALAHEYMARCFLRRNQFRNARAYLQDAYAAYYQFGCKAKANQLQNAFPQLLEPGNQNLMQPQFGSHSSRILDINTVLKSAQTISSQMKLENLLETLITLVIENAGAERGLLLLMERDHLIVEAEDRVDLKPRVLQNEPIEYRDDLCLSIVHYVQNTHEPVILSDATDSGPYVDDPYIIKNKPLSILCAPIIYQNYLFGILYLENNLVRDAFTQKHLELLHVLSAQIAISLENAKLYSAYDQFIPHEFLDILGKHSIMDIHLGDNVQKEMSVLFTDIRGFSMLTEQLGPEEIFKLMNNYLGHMGPIIKKHGGFIDKYIGDAIMALFAAKVESAISAGIDMQKELDNFNQELISQGKQPISIGIGINSGILILGTLGSLNRIETSVISDAVNLAERIQELTKIYDCRLLIGGSTYKKLVNPEQFNIRFIERTNVRGKEQEIDIWEVYNGDPDELRYAKLAIAKHYNEAITLFFEKSYQKALNLFQRCLTSLPNDKVIQMYVSKCQAILESEREKNR